MKLLFSTCLFLLTTSTVVVLSQSVGYGPKCGKGRCTMDEMCYDGRCVTIGSKFVGKGESKKPQDVASSLEYSFRIFSVAYQINMVALAVLFWGLRHKTIVLGVSLRAHQCLALSTLLRVIWTSKLKGFPLPFLYFEVLCSVAALVGIVVKLEKILEPEHKEKDKSFPWIVLVGASIFFGFITQAKASSIVNMNVIMYASYAIEAFSLLPQIILLYKTKELDSFTANYMCAVAGSHVIRLLFWFVMFSRGHRFWLLLLLDLAHTLILADFLLEYFRSVQSGLKGRIRLDV